jgi:AGCS family alanine or glycine:cation symporter
MVVPFMALGYIIVACVIIVNITELPGVILLIWKSAFGFEAVWRFWVRPSCGALSAASIPTRPRRDRPHASSAAVSHPVKAGLVQAVLGLYRHAVCLLRDRVYAADHRAV